jgi:hypothetical protein
MRLIRRLPFFVLLMICLTPFLALAADCPSTVKTALAEADQACADTGRNQACYGNIQLNAIAKDSAQKLTFNKPGDKVNVGALQSLKLSSMQQDSKEWGVALLKVQANIPDSIPGQNVTLLLFGDAELTPTGSSFAKLQAFTFKSSLSSTPCSEAPNGLLIQSPVGGQRVALTINGADFDIGSTVFISSEPGEGENTAGTGMSISTLAGIVRVTALGQTVTSIEGTATGVGLDNNLQPVEPPEIPAPLKADELSPLLTLVQSNKALLTPLADDAAANTTIADLTAQGLLPPITSDNPVSAIDADKLDDATQKANDALSREATPEATP